MKKICTGFDKCVYWIETLISTLSLIAIVTLVFLQVVMRYLFSKSFAWGEEVIITLILTMAMFGAARAVRSKGHAEVNGIVNALPKPLAIAVRTLTTLIVIVLLVLTAYACFLLGSKTNGVTMMLRYPMKWNYWALGSGACLTAYEFVKVAKRRIMGEY